ncbi:MAG: hypothetical protein AAGJ93_09270, partial [Bacteroidota bacterium]
MSNKEQRHINLLRRWISGDITAEEERKLEEAAAQDEMLRDAWAGYQINAEADHSQKLAKLRDRLAQRQLQAAKPRLLRPWIRIAAAVALLLVAGWFIVQNPMRSNDMLAKTEAAAPAEPEEIQKDAPVDNTTFAQKEEVETVMERESTPSLETIEEIPDFAVPSGVRASSSLSYSISPGSEADETESVTEELSTAMNTTPVDQMADATNDGDTNLTLSKDAEIAPIILDGIAVEAEEIVTTSPPPPPAAARDVYRTQNQGSPPARLEDLYSTS